MTGAAPIRAGNCYSVLFLLNQSVSDVRQKSLFVRLDRLADAVIWRASVSRPVEGRARARSAHFRFLSNPDCSPLASAPAVSMPADYLNSTGALPTLICG